MPIQVTCDMCGARVADVPLKDIRGWIKQNGERCKGCTLKLNNLNELVDKKTAALIKRVTAFKANFFSEIEKEVRKISEANK